MRDVHRAKPWTTSQKTSSTTVRARTLHWPGRARGQRSQILPQVCAHLALYVDDEPDAFVFTTPSGKTIWRGNFNKLVDWRRTVASIGAAELHFHDLRHTGNTLAARTGTSLRDLMSRMGHDNPRAALIYKHASAEADLATAVAINAMVEAATSAEAESEESTKTSSDDDSSDDDQDGTGVAGDAG